MGLPKCFDIFRFAVSSWKIRFRTFKIKSSRFTKAVHSNFIIVINYVHFHMDGKLLLSDLLFLCLFVLNARCI